MKESRTRLQTKKTNIKKKNQQQEQITRDRKMKGRTESLFTVTF